MLAEIEIHTKFDTKCISLISCEWLDRFTRLYRQILFIFQGLGNPIGCFLRYYVWEMLYASIPNLTLQNLFDQ